MFEPQSEYNAQNSKQQLDQDVNRGLALLVLIAVSVPGSSWLFFLPIYFNSKIAAQIFPLLFSIVLLFTVTRIQLHYLNKIAVPLGFITVFSSWSYVIFLSINTEAGSVKDLIAAQYSGMSDIMYLLGLCFAILWLGRYCKFNMYLSLLSITTLIVLLLIFSNIQMAYLLALILLLGASAIIAVISFGPQSSISETNKQAMPEVMGDDFFLPSELEEHKIKPELDINTLSLNETSVNHDWELILRELHGELKTTVDVDQLFKRMLVFLHGAMEFDAAAVGMLQDKSIKKIAIFGSDEYLHSRTLNWTNQRVKQVFKLREPILSAQDNSSRSTADTMESIHRLDVPVISNQKVLGLVTIFREAQLFDTHDIKLVASIVFHSMVALRQARLQDEIKRLSSETVPIKLTLYTREQFVTKVKPVIDKLSRPRECSLFIVEIDNLDSIISQQGRAAGSLLYKAVSKVIMSQLKQGDVFGRYGNEGYVILLDEIDLMSAKEIAEKIRSKISQIKLKYQGDVITTTVSVGLTIVSDAEESLPSLMRKADMGLFVAKENGYNTIKVSL